LGAVVAHYLFKTFPYKDEGFLTKMRSKIVSRAQLNQLARKMGLDELMDVNVSNKAKHGSITGDAFEALIGAIYLDRGYNAASDFIINRIIKFHLNIDDIENRETDFKSKLVEWSQKEKQEVLFEVVEEPSALNNMQYSVRIVIGGNEKGRAVNFSKKKAEQIAAEAACESLQI
jgi:ribonuclease-3